MGHFDNLIKASPYENYYFIKITSFLKFYCPTLEILYSVAYRLSSPEFQCLQYQEYYLSSGFIISDILVIVTGGVQGIILQV